MIDFGTAKVLINRSLAAFTPEGGPKWVIDEEQAEEFDIGWLPCWIGEDILHRDPRPQMAGNCPVFVHGEDGELQAFSMKTKRVATTQSHLGEFNPNDPRGGMWLINPKIIRWSSQSSSPLLRNLRRNAIGFSG